MRILCPEPQNFSDAARDFCSERYEAVFEEMDEVRASEEMRRSDAVITRFTTRVGADVMGAGTRLKAVLSPTTGLDHIDLAAAKRARVKLFHLRGQKRFLKTISPTAELTIGLMLSVMRRIPSAREAVLNGAWSPADFRGNELDGKTLGIIGLGRLGEKVARIAVAFGMNVLAFDIADRRRMRGVTIVADMAELLRRADIVSVHVPLNEGTVGLLGPKEISAMKPGSCIINTARGAVVDTDALLTALRSGHIAGAGLDVLDREHEIVRCGHPLIDYARGHDSLVITPHIGGASVESVERTDLFVLERFDRWLRDSGLATA